jgi:CHAT domain-containing protein
MTLNNNAPTIDELIQATKGQNLEEELMVEKVMKIFRDRDLASQRQLLEQCPSFPAKSAFLELIDSDCQAAHINTLGILAMAYAWTPPRELAIIFGKVGYFLAKDYRRSPDAVLTPEIRLTASTQSVRGCSTALYTLGRYEDVLEFGEPAFDWLEQDRLMLKSSTDERSKKMVRDNLNDLRLRLIDASLKCQRYEKAQFWVESQEKHATQLIEADRFRFEDLKLSLKTLTVTPEKLTSVPTEDKFTAISMQMDVLKNQLATNSIKGFPHETDSVASIISEISQIQASIDLQRSTSRSDLTSSQSTGIDAIEIGTRVEALMARIGMFSEIEQIRQKIDAASGIFLDPKKEHDPILIEQSLTALQSALQWTRENHFLEEECYAQWGISICYRRQEKLQSDPRLQQELAEKSVDMLHALRKNIELIRSRIIDPNQRVYWINVYVYLFPLLCEQLYKLDRPLELLDAIEGSKGRVLADVLTRKDDRPIADFDFSASVRQLPAMMQKNRAHYLTYLVDDEQTFAVLVTKNGSLHMHSIAIGKTHLKEWLAYDRDGLNQDPLDPKNWNNKISGKRKVVDLSTLLQPMVSWLEPYAEAGLIEPNDHLCYSPDASLHLVPLHYLPFLGKPMVCYVSVSRIHGAAALVELLKQTPEKPSRLTAIYVPATGDTKNEKGKDLGQQKLEDMRCNAYWLKDTKKMPGTVISEAAADLDTIIQLPFSQRLIHFSTHGIFPPEEKQDTNGTDNPYYASGLVLAKEGQLPSNDKGQGGALLTPERIIKGKLNFAGSHVTMQACVSGRAKEGIGGDAIGLDWAFMLAKASSLLSSHWDAKAGSAKMFCQTFYQYWLFEENYSRAQAWQKTVIDLMESQKTSSPHHWAAFSLSGDWR